MRLPLGGYPLLKLSRHSEIAGICLTGAYCAHSRCFRIDTQATKISGFYLPATLRSITWHLFSKFNLIGVIQITESVERLSSQCVLHVTETVTSDLYF